MDGHNIKEASMEQTTNLETNRQIVQEDTNQDELMSL